MPNILTFVSILGILFFFLVMIAKKQLSDWFDYDFNLIYAFAGCVPMLFITFFFGLKWGFITGLVGMIAGIIIGGFFTE